MVKSKPIEEKSLDDQLPSSKSIAEDPGKPSSSKVDKEEERNQWNEFGDAFQTFSNDGKRTERQKKKELDRETSSIDQVIIIIMQIVECLFYYIYFTGRLFLFSYLDGPTCE